MLPWVAPLLTQCQSVQNQHLGLVRRQQTRAHTWVMFINAKFKTRKACSQGTGIHLLQNLSCLFILKKIVYWKAKQQHSQLGNIQVLDADSQTGTVPQLQQI